MSDTQRSLWLSVQYFLEDYWSSFIHDHYCKNHHYWQHVHVYNQQICRAISHPIMYLTINECISRYLQDLPTWITLNFDWNLYKSWVTCKLSHYFKEVLSLWGLYMYLLLSGLILLLWTSPHHLHDSLGLCLQRRHGLRDATQVTLYLQMI